jgi:hypothetical protein
MVGGEAARIGSGAYSSGTGTPGPGLRILGRCALLGCCILVRWAPRVDGDLIGGPVGPGGPTRLYLSGPAAGEVATLFAPTDLEAVALAGDVAAASALKMCYAAWTKGTSALLLAIRAAAAAHGVEEALLAEWARTQPDLAARSQAAVGTARKAWRFAGEMDQIAAGFAEAGLPDGFARAAAELYRRLAAFKDLEGDPPLDEVLGWVRARSETPGS